MRATHVFLPLVLTSLCIAIASLSPAPADAAPPWAKLVPFTNNKVDANPDKDYELTESQGPWMIMCTSFTGPQAEEQAYNLVLELRQKYNLQAFKFRQNFDFTKPEVGLGLDKYGGKKLMRNRNGYKRDEIAVLVGNFNSVEQPDIEKTLQLIKTAQPDALNRKKTGTTNQTWANIRAAYRDMAKMDKKKEKGPMGSAFATRNPLLPEEFFATKGLDPFLVKINSDEEFSLLKCPGKYTVKVASFRGVESLKPAEFEKLAGKLRDTSKMTKIEEAGVKAIKLTRALRDKGVEAYTFHDRTESMVCIGSFESVGEPRDDGKIEINPKIHQIMETYGPIKKVVPGQKGILMSANLLEGIPFDPQPIPVVVPKQSIANDYVRRISHED